MKSSQDLNFENQNLTLQVKQEIYSELKGVLNKVDSLELMQTQVFTV